MSFIFQYLNKPIFHYDSSNEELKCPYCSEVYDVNCNKVKANIKHMITSKQLIWNNLLIRCIKCDLYVPEYPFKRYDPLILNEQQKAVIEELYQQILITSKSDYTEHLFLVEGYAGTGKTSVVTYLLKYEEFHTYKICFSAPTNKALQVLMDKLDNKHNNEQADDLDNDVPQLEDEKKWMFKTVFKLLNNKMNVNERGETKFETKQGDVKFKSEIIVIDEASMVEAKHLEHLFQLVENQKKISHMGVIVPIIIFLGDVGQLPPVGEDESIIFRPQIQKKNKIKRMRLTTIMRSQDKITDLSLNVRDLIPMDIDNKIQKDMATVDMKKYIGKQINYFDNRSDWVNNYATVFKNNLNQNDQVPKSMNAPIILVYTNPEGALLNAECRNIIFNHPQDKYVKGELLVFSEYYCIKRQKMINVKKDETTANITTTNKKSKTENYFVKFYTSDPIIVENVVMAETTIPNFMYNQIFRSTAILIEKVQKKIQESSMPKQNKEVYIRLVAELLPKWTISDGITTNEPILDKSLNKLKICINQLSHTYDTYQLHIDGKKKLDSADIDPKNCMVNTIRETSTDEYAHTILDIKLKIKSTYDLLSKTYKNNHLMKFLIDYIFQQIWLKYYYQSYIWPFAKVVYGYAITTHKSQGSTYENIYVNVPNILGCKKVRNTIKMKSLYTAMTRASKFVNVHYYKPSMLPLFPDDKMFKCHLCMKTFNGTEFPSVNCTFDKICADRVLIKLKPTHLYHLDEKYVVLSDKSKNLYRIPKVALVDLDITDAYNYVKINDLSRGEADKYQHSNILLAIELNKLIT